MKNFKMLNKTEMRKIVGGLVVCPPGYTPCSDSGCMPIEEPGGCDEGVGIVVDTSKIEACRLKKDGDYCVWSHDGIPEGGYCRSFMAGELHCSDLR